MSDLQPEPTGLTRRRRRLSDEETERRMLDAALAMVGRAGLTVSLEHLSFEDVIRDAGVSRSAVYRRWPYKDLFFSDLLRELAEAAGAGALPDDTATRELLARVVGERLDWLQTPEGRVELVVELLRQAGIANFQFFHESPGWRSYLALHASFLSLPESTLRDEIQAALTRSEAEVTAQIAAEYEQWCALLGFRLRPQLGQTWQSLAATLDATMRGLMLMAPTVPGIAEARFQSQPAGAAAAAEWSQPALAIATLVTAAIEPDPAVEWDAERLARVRAELTPA